MQLELMHESIEDAVKEVAYITGGTKSLSQHLWCPAISSQSAHTKMLDCLNPDRPHKLAPSELIAIGRIGREHGCDAIARFICAEMGYQEPIAKNADAERDEVREKIAMGLSFLQQNMKKFERLGGTV